MQGDELEAYYAFFTNIWCGGEGTCYSMHANQGYGYHCVSCHGYFQDYEERLSLVRNKPSTDRDLLYCKGNKCRVSDETFHCVSCFGALSDTDDE
jgi:hypothetical protein